MIRTILVPASGSETDFVVFETALLQELKEESEIRWEAAQRHVREFCKQHKIKMADAPHRLRSVSASWREERATERNLSLRERAFMISRLWVDSPIRTVCRRICSASCWSNPVVQC